LPEALGTNKDFFLAAGNKILEGFYMFEDKVLSCRDCSEDFTFSASEQEFFSEKGFTNEPGRCPTCRAARKQQNRGNSGGYNSGGYNSQPREMFPVVCATCGKETTVPFQPTGDRPVYCRECYQPRQRSNW
jgi:CxxC-x17-CxxC domain-containing protein